MFPGDDGQKPAAGPGGNQRPAVRLPVVDMLLEHYKGAIVMADGVLADGRDAEVALLASWTVAYSQRAIGQLSRWRRRWAEPFLQELTRPAAQSTPASS